MDLTTHWVGVAAIVLFVAAYALVVTEEFTHLRKSKAGDARGGHHLGPDRVPVRPGRSPSRGGGRDP